MSETSFDLLVIGAGIVGISTALQISRTRPDWRIAVLEKEPGAALHQTGHNSGVIHAGVYYAPGSLKARFCKAGNNETVAFCREQGLPFEICGKLLVATDEVELQRMDALEQRCKDNGLKVERLGPEQVSEREPNIRGLGALYVPTSGITDYAAMARRMADLLTERGGELIYGAQPRSITEDGSGVTVETGSRTYRARYLVACAGLQSDRVARMAGLNPGCRIVPFRGEFFKVRGKNPGFVRSLIYPIPDPSMPFVGIHLTRMIDGTLKVGPNALMNPGRETYRKFAFNPRDLVEAATYPGLWRLVARNAGYAREEIRNSLSKRRYLEICRRYCPDLTLDDLVPGKAGIRAQAVAANGDMIGDFLIRSTDRMVHLCNAPSPAATSALPIGAHLRDMVLSRVE